MEKKFKALRFIGTVYKVIGIIAGALTAISAIGFCLMSILGGSLFNAALNSVNQYGYGGSGSSGPAGVFGGILGGVIIGGLILLYGGITSITLYAFGEGIYLLIGLEENTRNTAFLLQQGK
jgi:hypothetical protein